MSKRYTNKALEELSDLQFIRDILYDRMSTLNPYSPLAAKLRCAINTLGNLDRPRNQSSWQITYTDEQGETRRPSDLDDDELERIGRLIKEGYVGGEILN